MQRFEMIPTTAARVVLQPGDGTRYEFLIASTVHGSYEVRGRLGTFTVEDVFIEKMKGLFPAVFYSGTDEYQSNVLGTDALDWARGLLDDERNFGDGVDGIPFPRTINSYTMLAGIIACAELTNR